jgi:hypothetical protein
MRTYIGLDRFPHELPLRYINTFFAAREEGRSDRKLYLIDSPPILCFFFVVVRCGRRS